MATTTGFRLFLALLVVITLAGTVSGIRCYHCMQMRKVFMGEHSFEVMNIEQPTSSKYPSHHSCNYEDEPDSSLSVECSVPGLVPAYVRDNFELPDRYEELERSIDTVVKLTHGRTFSCAAVLMIETERGPNDSIIDVEVTIRSCFPVDENFTSILQATELKGYKNVSGYTCREYDNCNGKAGAQSHQSIQVPPANSADIKIEEISPLGLAILTTCSLMVSYLLHYNAI
ncbi:unnamed protein product [Orchesella dallaii]|uniref:Uncharacterized protein n=1 Tax=Orchesella dallaii TaxID=48710 RepID=A0ABP1QC31_9HEXA